MADYLSWLESSEAGDGVRDELPDGKLFMVTVEPTTDANVTKEDK